MTCSATLRAGIYDLDATLDSGQAFRWRKEGTAWTGVVAGRWVELRAGPGVIEARTAVPVPDWNWLADYLQVDVDVDQLAATFPEDAPMRAAAAACRGLHLLRQEPWECLASFILSSTKQIVQIRQVVESLCCCHGAPIAVPPGAAPAWSFPGPQAIASVSEAQLRACKMGFRAPYLLAAARAVAAGSPDLELLRGLPLDEARQVLVQLPGVGPKIADCVLLFAYGQPRAFPIDVWIMRALKALYFPRRRVAPKRLRRFSETHFGPHSGYAQQLLFHYARSRRKELFAPAARSQ